MIEFPLRLPGIQRPVAVTRHALLRYQERVRPALSGFEALAGDMQRLADVCGSLRATPPPWVAEDWNREGAPDDDERLWLECGDIALVLVPALKVPLRTSASIVVATVLARGGIGSKARERRNSQRSARTHGRRKRSRTDRYRQSTRPVHDWRRDVE